MAPSVVDIKLARLIFSLKKAKDLTLRDLKESNDRMAKLAAKYMTSNQALLEREDQLQMIQDSMYANMTYTMEIQTILETFIEMVNEIIEMDNE